MSMRPATDGGRVEDQAGWAVVAGNDKFINADFELWYYKSANSQLQAHSPGEYRENV
jgi:hypothetical protein